jgi:hypothetical protein
MDAITPAAAANQPVQLTYAGMPDAVKRFPNPIYQSNAPGGGGGGGGNNTGGTYHESEPVPTDQDYVEMALAGGGSMPARAAEGDYSSYTVAGAPLASNQDNVEMNDCC